MLITLYQNDSLSNKVIMVVGMLLTGVTGGFLLKDLVNIKFDRTFDEDEAQKIVWGMIIGLFLVVFLQFIFIGFQVNQSSFNTSYEASLTLAFYICVAVSEEFFFRFFTYSIIRKIFEDQTVIPGFLISNLGTSFIFMVFHLAVYGASMNTVLITVFLSSVVFCFVYEYTKRITATLVIHVFVNAMASGYFNFIFSGGLLT